MILNLLTMATIALGLTLTQEDPGPSETSQDPPSLDELLGIEGDPESGEAADVERERSLDRALADEKPAVAFKQAILDMDRSSQRLRDKQATGLGTQRLQTRIIDRLQALIESAQRQQQQQQQSSPSSSNSDSGQDPGSRSEGEQEGQQQQAQQEGQSQGQDGAQTPGTPPPPEHAVLQGTLDETRIEWGNLPPRVRELINQGMRDRMSELYRSMTEAYYKRMAEDAS